MHAGSARSRRLPVETTMSAAEDVVAPFVVRLVGSADDWEALLARVQAFHGVSWQRRKDINDEDCERTWRALSGNSTPNDFAQSSVAFSGVWSASIRQEVYHTIGKLCVCKAGKAPSIQPPRSLFSLVIAHITWGGTTRCHGDHFSLFWPWLQGMF